MSISQIANKVINELQNIHPAFINEAHFQYEFALKLAELYNNGQIEGASTSTPEISLERYVNEVEANNKNSYRTDLAVKDGANEYAFEFKYFTDEVEVEIRSNVKICLKNQSGGKQRKIAVWRDIEKLEELKRKNKCTEGCFILISNDMHTINSTCHQDSIDLNINPGKTAHFENKKLNFTFKGQPDSCQIAGKYTFDYKQYSKVKPNQKNSEFKYLILEV